MRAALGRVADRAVSVGLWALLFLAPLKWGLPILEPERNFFPSGLAEWLGASWPHEIFILGIGYLFLIHCVGSVIRGDAFRLGPWYILAGPTLFFIVAAIAGLFSVHQGLALSYVLAYGAYVLLFFLILSRQDLQRSLLFAVSLSAGIVAMYAMYQRFVGFGQTAQWASLYLEGHPYRDIIQAKLASGRVFGTLVYPNSLGGYMVMTIPVVLAWFLEASRGGRFGWLLMAFPVAGIIALALSGSQGSFVVMGLVGLGLGAVGMGRRLKARGAIGVRLIFFLAGLCLAALCLNLFPQAVKWDTLLMRWTYWAAAFDMGCSGGWLGYGPGSFAVVYPQFMLSWGGETQLAHSHVLQIFAEMGWVGAFAWGVWWFGWLLIPGTRDGAEDGWVRCGIGAGLIAFLLHGFVDFDFFVPGITLQAVFLCAIAWSRQGPRHPRT